MSEQPPYPGPQGQPGQPPYQQGGYPSAGYSPPGYPQQGYGQPGPGWQQPPEMVGPAPGVRFAGHGARIGAYVVDAIIVGILVNIVFFAVAIPVLGATLSSINWNSLRDAEHLSPQEAIDLFRPFLVLIPLAFGVMLLALAYFVVGWARGGQTLGMKMAGIRVVRDRDGGRIGWGAAIVRLIGYAVSGAALYLGFIWILIDSRRRGWHDLLAGTVVVSNR